MKVGDGPVRTSAGELPREADAEAAAAADVAFVPFEADLLGSGDCENFCAAVQPRLNAYADAGVTWITIEPASRSFTDFRTDIDMLTSLLIDR